MRRALLLLIGASLALPGAAAWGATLVSAPDAVSLRESLLLAGALQARVEGGAFGAPRADLLAFDVPATVRMCADAGSGDPAPASCNGETTTLARLHVHAGGFVVLTEPSSMVRLESAATAAALGGANVTLNQYAIGAGVYSGGETTVTAQSTTLVLRPLDPAASLEVRGDEGFRTYNGTKYTMYISGINETILRARGAFLAGEEANATLSRASLREAETGIRVEDLYELLHAIQPPASADRRVDIAGAFGPFQLVPPLLNGAAAARVNLTLNDAPRDAFTFLRMEELRIARDGANWTGSGNATYLVEGETVAPSPGRAVKFPLWLPILVVGAAIGARMLTHRDAPRKRARIWAHVGRIGGLLALAVMAGALLSPLLGFSPILHAGTLSPRSRAQLLLLCAGMVGTAWLTLGFASESLARSVFAWRDRTRAVVVPVLVGIVVAAAFLLLATATLLSTVARFVRL